MYIGFLFFCIIGTTHILANDPQDSQAKDNPPAAALSFCDVQPKNDTGTITEHSDKSSTHQSVIPAIHACLSWLCTDTEKKKK